MMIPAIAKLDYFFERELRSDLKEVLITCDKYGKYSLFGKYTIVTMDNGHFKTFTPKHAEENNFSTLTLAVAWCTLHNTGLYKEANKLISLDLKLCSLAVDIDVHERLVELSSVADTRCIIYEAKLAEDTFKQHLLTIELNSYINTSKQIQDRKFGKTNQSNSANQDKYLTRKS